MHPFCRWNIYYVESDSISYLTTPCLGLEEVSFIFIHLKQSNKLSVYSCISRMYLNFKKFTWHFLKNIDLLIWYWIRAWPSGKATGFGPVIRRFESFRPKQWLNSSLKKNKKNESKWICFDKNISKKTIIHNSILYF